MYQILVLVIYWYQWDTPNHSTYPKSWLVAFKTVVECLKLLKNGQNCRRSRLLLTRFNFGWGVLRWVAWTIWSDACLLDQITYVIFWFELFKNVALVIFWYQKGTPSHPTYPKLCLVVFKTAVECLKFLKNGQNCPRIRLLIIFINSHSNLPSQAY